MRIEVRDGPESRPEVAPLAAAVYPPEVLATVVWRNVVSARADRRILVYDGEALVAAAGVIFREGRRDGEPARIAGIGGVMTLPERQGQGFGKAAMLAAHDLIDGESGAEFGALFCEPRNFGFYFRLGWGRFAGTVLAEQPGSTGPYEVMPALVRPFRGGAPAGGVIDLCGLPW